MFENPNKNEILLIWILHSINSVIFKEIQRKIINDSYKEKITESSNKITEILTKNEFYTKNKEKFEKSNSDIKISLMELDF